MNPVKFDTNRKDVTRLSVNATAFGYAPHYYLKLDGYDDALSTTIPLASQGLFDGRWGEFAARWGGYYFNYDTIYFGSNGCQITNVVPNSDEYLVDYSCSLTMYRDPWS